MLVVVLIEPQLYTRCPEDMWQLLSASKQPCVCHSTDEKLRRREAKAPAQGHTAITRLPEQRGKDGAGRKEGQEKVNPEKGEPWEDGDPEMKDRDPERGKDKKEGKTKKREKQSGGPSLKKRRDLGRVWAALAPGAASEPKSEEKRGSRSAVQGG